LWVNLPAAQKMDPPRYQDVTEAEIPVVDSDGLLVRVVAGEYRAIQGPVTGIAAQPLYMDVTMDPSAHFELAVPVGHTAIAYLFEGQAFFGSSEFGALRMLEFGTGERLAVRTADSEGARFMFIAGAPFREPIVPYGPFVMNTEEEIHQAFVELRNGTFIRSQESN
jgi:redox-sensitive bicupin YhaK (pirin superfamily)